MAYPPIERQLQTGIRSIVGAISGFAAYGRSADQLAPGQGSSAATL
jgi:uncharacterized cupin superfamily protein